MVCYSNDVLSLVLHSDFKYWISIVQYSDDSGFWIINTGDSLSRNIWNPAILTIWTLNGLRQNVGHFVQDIQNQDILSQDFE